MKVSFKAYSYTDKDNLVLSLINGGYTVSVKHVERQLYDVPNPYWKITVHDYSDECEGFK